MIAVSVPGDSETVPRWRIQDFPGAGANPGDANLLFVTIFAVNCMNILTIGLGGLPRALLDPPLAHSHEQPC